MQPFEIQADVGPPKAESAPEEQAAKSEPEAQATEEILNGRFEAAVQATGDGWHGLPARMCLALSVGQGAALEASPLTKGGMRGVVGSQEPPPTPPW